MEINNILSFYGSETTINPEKRHIGLSDIKMAQTCSIDCLLPSYFARYNVNTNDIMYTHTVDQNATNVSLIEETVGVVDKQYEYYKLLSCARDSQMDILLLKEFISRSFIGIRKIQAVYLLPHSDYIEIITVLTTRDRRTRNSLFNRELKTLDKFSGLSLDFKVIFSNKAISDDELPRDSIKIEF